MSFDKKLRNTTDRNTTWDVFKAYAVSSILGLVYQQAPCNNKNALLVTIALCIPDDFAYELFATIGEVPPTPQSYVYKTVLANDKKREGVFQLSLSNKDFKMPSSGSGLKCNIGIRPYTGKYNKTSKLIKALTGLDRESAHPLQLHGVK